MDNKHQSEFRPKSYDPSEDTHSAHDQQPSLAAATYNGLTHSPLSKLPPEIRNKIYALILTHREPIRLVRQDKRRSKEANAAQIKSDCYFKVARYSNRKMKREDRFYNLTALLKTCRQVNHEATVLFYAVNCFVFHQRAGNGRIKHVLSCFFEQIGARNSKMIQHFSVHFHSMRLFETLWTGYYMMSDLMLQGKLGSCSLHVLTTSGHPEFKPEDYAMHFWTGSQGVEISLTRTSDKVYKLVDSGSTNTDMLGIIVNAIQRRRPDGA